MAQAAMVRKATLLDDERDLHVYTYARLLFEALGPGYLDWPAEALREELLERTGAGDIGELAWNRIQAGRLLSLHNGAWVEWHIFEKCCAAIVGKMPVFSWMQPPEVEEVAVAWVTLQRFASHELGDEVKRFMLASALHEGCWSFEEPLLFLRELLLQEDAEKGLVRAVGGVELALQSAKGYIEDINGPVDVQVNHVLSVRNVLRAYQTDLDKQLSAVPVLLKELR